MLFRSLQSTRVWSYGRLNAAAWARHVEQRPARIAIGIHARLMRAVELARELGCKRIKRAALPRNLGRRFGHGRQRRLRQLGHVVVAALDQDVGAHPGNQLNWRIFIKPSHQTHRRQGSQQDRTVRLGVQR